MVEMVNKISSSTFDGSVTVPSINENMEDNDMAIRDMKKVAYCCLLHYMNEYICFSLVDTAKTENLQDGDAALA